MSNYNNIRKLEQLGMPYGTANNKLRKLILFDCVCKLGKNICHQCDLEIDNIDNFSIEHKIPWLHSENPLELFFSIDNIAFSHLKCNVGARRKGNFIEGVNNGRPRKIAREGYSWCYECKLELPSNKFNSRKNRWSGLDYICKQCKYTNNV